MFSRNDFSFVYSDVLYFVLKRLKEIYNGHCWEGRVLRNRTNFSAPLREQGNQQNLFSEVESGLRNLLHRIFGAWN